MTGEATIGLGVGKSHNREPSFRSRHLMWPSVEGHTTLFPRMAGVENSFPPVRKVQITRPSFRSRATICPSVRVYTTICPLAATPAPISLGSVTSHITRTGALAPEADVEYILVGTGTSVHSFITSGDRLYSGFPLSGILHHTGRVSRPVTRSAKKRVSLVTVTMLYPPVSLPALRLDRAITPGSPPKSKSLLLWPWPMRETLTFRDLSSSSTLPLFDIDASRG